MNKTGVPGIGLLKGLGRSAWDWRLAWYFRLVYCASGIEEVSRLLHRLRKRQVTLILHQFGAIIGVDCDIETHLLIHNARAGFSHLSIGDRCHIGKDVLLDLSAPITIEDQATISMRVSLLTHIDVGKSSLLAQYPRQSGPIRICQNGYVGAGAIILHGVTIGEESMVAAGAVVNQNVPARTVVAGVPARVVGELLS